MRNWILIAILLGAGCASTGAVTPAQMNLETLRGRMLEARAPLRSYVAEARLTYFGPDGRIKGTATLALQRPASLRYEIQGPHGGVLEAFATDGVELQLLDFKSNRFIYGPSEPATIDQLLSFAPLGMDAEAWVDLLCGDLLPPPDAQVDATDGLLRIRWDVEGVTRVLYVNPADARTERAVAMRGETLLSEVRVEGRGDRGVPDRIELVVPEAEVDMEIRLRDVSFDPELEASVFRIDAPASAEKHYLFGARGP